MTKMISVKGIRIRFYSIPKKDICFGLFQVCDVIGFNFGVFGISIETKVTA
jgi:hypothetical protein